MLFKIMIFFLKFNKWYASRYQNATKEIDRDLI